MSTSEAHPADARSRRRPPWAIQVHGGAGVSADTPLAESGAHLRTLHLADGPDEVHLRSIAREELHAYR